MSRAIVLIDHGSRVAEANAVVERVAEGVRAARPDTLVEVAHLELAQPDLLSALRRCAEGGADEAVVCPYFLGPGRHTRDDIPKLVAQAREQLPDLRVTVAKPLGFDPHLVELVLARADGA